MAALFIFRITAGVIFLILGIFRLQYSGPEAFGFTLFHLASRGALGFFQPTFQQYILSYQKEVYYVLVILYLLLGVLFLLGAMVRYAAFLLFLYGALMLMSSFNLYNYMNDYSVTNWGGFFFFTRSWSRPNTWPGLLIKNPNPKTMQATLIIWYK